MPNSTYRVGGRPYRNARARTPATTKVRAHFRRLSPESPQKKNTAAKLVWNPSAWTTLTGLRYVIHGIGLWSMGRLEASGKSVQAADSSVMETRQAQRNGPVAFFAAVSGRVRACRDDRTGRRPRRRRPRRRHRGQRGRTTPRITGPFSGRIATALSTLIQMGPALPGTIRSTDATRRI